MNNNTIIFKPSQGRRQEFRKGGSILLTRAKCARKILGHAPCIVTTSTFIPFMAIVTVDMVSGRSLVCIILKVKLAKQGLVVAGAWKLMEGKLYIKLVKLTSLSKWRFT